MELVAGVFGWIWIIASIAALYFLVAALAFGGRWTNFFWALGTGVVAKWLARAFDDGKRQMERQVQPDPSVLVDGQISADIDNVLLDAQELVNRYGAVLGQSRSLIRSETELPANKDQIKEALVALARHGKRSGVSAEAIEPLRIGYASLADFVAEPEAQASGTFQSVIDARKSVFDPGTGEIDKARSLELAKRVISSGPAALDIGNRATAEFARLVAEFDERLQDER